VLDEDLKSIWDWFVGTVRALKLFSQDRSVDVWDLQRFFLLFKWNLLVACEDLIAVVPSCGIKAVAPVCADLFCSSVPLGLASAGLRGFLLQDAEKDLASVATEVKKAKDGLTSAESARDLLKGGSI
jgi:hypothetical protein